jgi:hypothetical protein
VTTSGQKRRMSATKRADALFSKLIRSRGFCELAEMRPETECSGALQCCHIISRRYRSIRWDENNALAGCQAHHTYFTHRPLEWEEAIADAKLGWSDIRFRALNEPPEHPKDALERLSLVDLQDRGQQ